MTERPDDTIETVFEDTGSLARPGIVGRLVRLGFGLWLMWPLYVLLTAGWAGLVDTTAPAHWTMWAFMAVAFWIIPYVINIGFTKNWRRRPQVAILLIAGVLIVVDLAIYGTWWGPPLGAFVWAWLVYFSAHLGFSFLLSALIATPGCEMRAIPHLWTLITGRATGEHYCPGVIDSVDKWEAGHSR